MTLLKPRPLGLPAIPQESVRPSSWHTPAPRPPPGLPPPRAAADLGARRPGLSGVLCLRRAWGEHQAAKGQGTQDSWVPSSPQPGCARYSPSQTHPLLPVTPPEAPAPGSPAGVGSPGPSSPEAAGSLQPLGRAAHEASSCHGPSRRLPGSRAGTAASCCNGSPGSVPGHVCKRGPGVGLGGPGTVEAN